MKTIIMFKSKSIKDNYQKSTVCLNLFDFVIFFFLNNAQIASWDGFKRESVVFTSAYQFAVKSRKRQIHSVK